MLWNINILPSIRARHRIRARHWRQVSCSHSLKGVSSFHRFVYIRNKHPVVRSSIFFRQRIDDQQALSLRYHRTIFWQFSASYFITNLPFFRLSSHDWFWFLTQPAFKKSKSVPVAPLKNPHDINDYSDEDSQLRSKERCCFFSSF